MTLNRMLSHARALRGWSQYRVASKIGTSRKSVSRWECGETFPSPYYRELLCELFELDTKALGLLPPSMDDDDADIRMEREESRAPIVSSAQFDDAQPLIGRDALLQNLLCQLQPGSILALTGLPGVGKTALLRKLLQYPQIQERFADGVIWVGLGPTPDIPRRLAWVARLVGFPEAALEQEDSEAERLHLLAQFLQETFTGSHLLIVLDDVWTVESALPFLIGHPSVTYLFTTRLPKVAFALASREPCMVPPLSNEESHQLLTSFVPGMETLEGTLQQIVAEFTGGLPLAGMLIGKYLALHSYGGHFRRSEMALNQLRDPEYRQHLSSPLLQVHDPSLQNNTAYHSLDTAIELSNQALSNEAQKALQALSVLPRAPEFFSEEAALVVAATGQDVLDQLVDGGLLEPIEKNCYRIHPIIADYARCHLKENIPQMRLAHYMENVCVDHRTNLALLEREYSTLLVGINVARAFGMYNEMQKGLLALAPLIRIRGESRQEDFAEFVQVRLDETQISGYQSFGQMLKDQQAGQKHTISHLIQIQKTVREQPGTQGQYVS